MTKLIKRSERIQAFVWVVTVLLAVSSRTKHGMTTFPSVEAVWVPRWFSRSRLQPQYSNEDPSQPIPSVSSSWSSYLTIDPSKLLSVLVKRGGLVLPKSVERELYALHSVLHADEAQLNLLTRQLILRNVTVRAGEQEAALRVGKVQVLWDSYVRPCVDMEVEDVDMVLEFVNLLLTRNNWNELEDAGFPPNLYDYSSTTSTTTLSNGASSSSFVRIGSIDLTGNVTARVLSRPLHKTLSQVGWPMRSLQGLYAQIRKVSDANLAMTGRRGCTTDELYEIMRSYFGGKLKGLLSVAAHDMASGSLPEYERSAVAEAKRLVAGAKDLIKDYTKEASRKTEGELHGSLAAKLEQMGLSSADDKLAALRDLSVTATRTLDTDRIVRKAARSHLKRLRNVVTSFMGEGKDPPLSSEAIEAVKNVIAHEFEQALQSDDEL